MLEVLIFILVGVFTGLSAGLLGVGGGIVSVPAMILILPMFDVADNIVVHIAIATSLLLIIPTAVISTLSHHRLGAIDWDYVFRIMPGLTMGASVGVYFALLFDRILLQSVFAIFLFAIAVYMLLGKRVNSSASIKSTFLIPGIFIGGISSMMGVGGGTMIVPFFMRNGLTLKGAIASSSASGIPIAIAASLTFYFWPNDFSAVNNVSLIHFPAFLGILIGAIVFTPLGAKLTQIIDTQILRKIFIMIILITSVKLLFF